MREPPCHQPAPAAFGRRAEQHRLEADLLHVPGVSDVLIVLDEAAAYVKVDTTVLDRDALDRLVA